MIKAEWKTWESATFNYHKLEYQKYYIYFSLVHSIFFTTGLQEAHLEDSVNTDQLQKPLEAQATADAIVSSFNTNAEKTLNQTENALKGV